MSELSAPPTPLDARLHTGDALREGRDGASADLRASFREFERIVGDTAFPCFYATQSLGRDTFRFADLVWDEERGQPARSLAGMIEAYLAELKPKPMSKAAFHVLIVFIDFPGVPDAGLEDATMRAVQALMDHDGDHDGGRGGDPDTPEWALRFQGTALFINISTPLHVKRRSRSLGPRVAFVIQPRDGIDFIAPADETGDRVRELIRDRLDAYDDVPRSPDLSTHGSTANRDWKQFWLLDDDEARTGKCPLRS